MAGVVRDCYVRPLARDRAAAALGAAALQALILYALFVGLAVAMPDDLVRDLKLIALVPSPPPPPPPAPVVRPPPKQQQVSRTRAGGSPPNIRSRPTPVVAPLPIVRLPVPPLVAAPIPDFGSDPSRGAASRPGPGIGTGGWGRGTGDDIGDGPGDDDGGGIPPRLLRGRLRDSDYPSGAGEAGIGGTVSVRYRVEIDGRASDCLVTESSGSFELDDLTCRLIEQRFRFAPSRDRTGRPVRSYIVENHSWMVEDEPILPGTGRWRAQRDGGAARTPAQPLHRAARGSPPRYGED